MGKKQHYIPQFYLRGFTSDGSSIGFFRLSDETYRESVPVKSIMYDNWLYDEDNHVEHRLAEMESIWSASIASLLEILQDQNDEKVERLAPLEDERAHLLHFIGCTMTRTLGSLSAMYGLVNAMVDDLKATVPNFDPEKTGQLSQYNDRHEYTEVMLTVGEDLPIRLLDLAWVYIVNESGMPLMTSDNPVALINSYFSIRGLRPTYGLGSSGIQIFLPLTSKVCLVLLDKEVYELTRTTTVLPIESRHVIRDINTITARNAFSYLAFNPALPKCEIKGMARKRKDIKHSRLGVFEVAPNQNLYTFANVRLNDRLLIPGIPIREEALSWPVPVNAAGWRRSYSIMLDSMEESNREECLPDSFVAKFKRTQTIL